MKSTIRVDFKGGDGIHQGFEPVIRVNLQDSEDVRDGLLSAFFQALGGQSSWLVVDFFSHKIDGVDQNKQITISPVHWSELEETRDIIERRIESFRDPKIDNKKE